MAKDKLNLTQRFKRLVNMGHDKAPEEEIINSIEDGTEFHGAKLWILVLAIFVASLGLNTNSAAVIIGAMLISPLMGPILGMGLGVGIYDFELLKRALRNYLVTTLFSVCTAFIYFSLSPLTEAQSELLARTSPTIYDVCIALCGGLAGILALSSKSQRTGNVIPGVAIATALMPPLCTVGYGLALGNWSYALGAFYLYLINTVFIASSTFVGVNFILKMHKKKQVDDKRARRVRHIILTIAALTMVPSIWLTIDIVQDTVYKQRVRQFVQTEVVFPTSHLLNYSSDSHEGTIRLVLLGDVIDSTQIKALEAQMKSYNLENAKLQIVQGHDQLSASEIRSLIDDKQESNTLQREQAEERVMELELLLKQTQAAEQMASEVYPELVTLFPDVTDIALLKGRNCYQNDSIQADSTLSIALIKTKNRPSNEDMRRMEEWLRQRTHQSQLQLLVK